MIFYSLAISGMSLEFGFALNGVSSNSRSVVLLFYVTIKREKQQLA